jgi:hypothetical protein
MISLFKKKDIDPNVFVAASCGLVSLSETDVVKAFIVCTHERDSILKETVIKHVMDTNAAALKNGKPLVENYNEIGRLAVQMLGAWVRAGLVKRRKKGIVSYVVTKKGWQVRQLQVLTLGMRGGIYDRMKDFTG